MWCGDVYIHDVCTLCAGGCLRSINPVSLWYPLVGNPSWGTPPPLGQAGPSVAMVNLSKVGRYQGMPKESQTRGHSVRIVWQFEAKKKLCLLGPLITAGQSSRFSSNFFAARVC